MEKIDILLWAIGGGFAGTWMMMFFLVKSLGEQIKDVKRSIEKLDEKATDIDRRLCRLEGAFSSKDCCMIKDERQTKKAE